MNNNSNQTTQWIVGFVLVVIALTVFAQAEGFAVLLLLGGLAYFASRFGTNANTSRGGAARSFPREAEEEAIYDEPETYRQAQAEPVYKHALESVRRAGQDPNSVQVLPVDIGVMAFKGDDEPVVYRTWAIPDDVDYIQPFVQLRLPTKATGKVRFEILDGEGEVMFIHEDHHQLVRGRNLVTPSARFPVHDALAMDNRWSLRVSADGTVIAQHYFEWEEATSNTIRRHLTEDGEISNEMRAALAENRLQKMSLDELLSFQEDEQPAPRQQRR